MEEEFAELPHCGDVTNLVISSRLSPQSETFTIQLLRVTYNAPAIELSYEPSKGSSPKWGQAIITKGH